MMRRCALAALVLLAAACAQLGATLGGGDQAGQVAYLVSYAQNVAAMRPDSQRRELNDAKQTYAQDHTPYASVRLALLLSLPGTAFWDDAGAAGLLEPLAAPGADGAATDTLRQFAGWLHAQIAERVREQKRSAQLKEQFDAERAREQKKSAMLKEQLDALRAIERTLIDRQGESR